MTTIFLDASGPTTPISDAIARVVGLADPDWPIAVFWSAAVLLAIGGLAGFCLGALFSPAIGR